MPLSGSTIRQAACVSNLSDGDVIGGDVTITANDGADNASTVIAVDGTERSVAPMLEDGAWFMVKTSGMDSYFKECDYRAVSR